MKTCKGCGALFSGGRSDKVYCSRVCKEDHFCGYTPKFKGAPCVSRACVGCGAIFWVHLHPEKIYCTRQCKKNAAARKARKERPKRVLHIPRPCRWCGVVFVPRRSDALACSLRCEHLHRSRAWKKQHPERAATHNRKWVEAHPDSVRSRCHRRRARKRAAAGDFSGQDLRELRRILGDVCPACLLAYSDSIDHIIPLSKGGSNHPTNLQFLCCTCNSKKSVTRTDYRTKAQRRAVLEAFQLKLFA